MSEHRRPTIPFSDAPRGTCRWCGEPIVYAEGPRAGKPDRRRRWHPACVAEYNFSDPREARGWLRRRERGVCRACGLDTYRVRREMRALKRGRAAELRRRGFHPRQSLWELDHVVPLIDGGTHGRDNLQTLCVPCHRQKTAQEARARAERRRADAAEAVEAPPEIRRRSRRKAPAATDLDSALRSADAANERAERLLSELDPPRP